METEPKITLNKSRTFLKERLLRFRPIVVVRKNIFLFSLILLFVLSWLLGFWDIKKYEIYDLNGEDLKEDVFEEVEQYFQDNIYGQNYFLFAPLGAREDMYLNLAKLKSVRIEKVVPNKVAFFVQTYSSKYAAFLKGQNCNILSQDGVVLEKVCEDLAKECCEEYAFENSLIFLESQDVEVSSFDNEKDRLLIMEEIGKVVNIVETFKYEVVKITLENDILQLQDNEERLFRFTIADDIDVQLKRFVVVVGKIKAELMDIGTLDLRFERPVMLE